MKKKGTAIVSVLAGTVLPVAVVAAGSVSDMKTSGDYNWNHNYYTEIVEYTCTGTAQDYDFAEEITLKNRTYILQESETEVIFIEIPDMEPEEKTVTYTGLTSEELAAIEQSLTASGVSYDLSTQDVTEQEQTEQLSSYRMSGLVYEAPDISTIPATDIIEYESPLTGETTVQELPYVSMALAVPYEWTDDFVLDFTLEVYEAEYFLIGENRVYLDKDAPVLPEESKETILASVGLPSASFTIDRMEWTSEIYTDQNGVSCRDARVSGKQLLGVYRINYEDENCKTGTLYDVTATYTMADEDFQEQVAAASVYYCKSEAHYKAESPVTWWQIIVMVLVILAMLFLLFLLCKLLRRRKRRKQGVEETVVRKEPSVVIKQGTPDTFTIRNESNENE